MKYLLACLLYVWSTAVWAQRSGIKGIITDQKGEAVPFASIGVEKQPAGTMANQEGRYQLELAPGQYRIYFQCLGYQTQALEVEVKDGLTTADIQLTEVAIQMKEVTVASRNEDPAYGIMRKAIARAKINKMMVDSYKARVYIRGSGRVIEIPFLLRSVAKSNGWDANTVFFTETLENLEFKQPNIYKETVIAARSTAGNVKIGQRFIKEDLYEPKYGPTISPLSPSAFRTYRFQYLGAFTDRGHEVFKIKVIPRLEGENVCEGEIYIIDQLWCIHSAHLKATVEDIEVEVNNLYAPLEGIWLPVQVKQDFKGKVLGISFEGTYNSSLSQYRIVKNEKLYADYKALEQKIDDKITEELQKPREKIDLKKKEKEEKKLLNKMAKTYVKEKFKEKLGLKKKEKNTAPQTAHIVSEANYEVDSNAFKKDSVYWEQNRDVPLTTMEIKSYHKLDSIRVKEEKEDSLKAKKSKGASFGISEFLLGTSYSFGKPDSLKRKPFAVKYFSPFTDIQFNAVEGYAGSASIWLKTNLKPSTNQKRDDRDYLQFGPTVRYSFGRNKVLGHGTLQYKNAAYEFQLAGGTQMRQVNNNEPIAPWLNSLYALIDTRNFSKLYQEEFVHLKALRRLTGRLEVETELQWANRMAVTNSVEKGIWGKSKSFEPNTPAMPYASGAMPSSTVAFTWSGKVDWYPTLAAHLYNDRVWFEATSSPRIRLQFVHAIPGLASSTIDFTSLGISYLQQIPTSEQSSLDIYGRFSGLVRNQKTGQMDMAQVLGNQTFVLTGTSLESFRNLPYYAFASSRAVAELHLEWLHKRLLLGWIWRKKTWQEAVILKGMTNPGQPAFYEVGYGIDQLFRFLRIEGVRSQLQGSAPTWCFRIGFVRSLQLRPSTYNKEVETGFSF